MKKTQFGAGMLPLLVVLSGPRAVDAAPHAYASVTGFDAGNCASVFTPCRTLAFAISAVDPGGEVVVLTSGSFGSASITIAKSVRVNAAPGVVALSHSQMSVAVAPSDTVVLRGLTLKASAPGVGSALTVVADGVLYVENCVIDGWNGSITFMGAGTPQAHILNTIVRNNNFGLLLSPGPGRTPQVTVQDSRFENNTNCGVSASSAGVVSVSNSVSSGNGWGFCAHNGGSLNVQDSTASSNTNQGFVAESNPTAGGIMRVTRSIATGNGTGFQNFPSPATFESLGNNLVRGNGTDVVGVITIISGN